DHADVLPGLVVIAQDSGTADHDAADAVGHWKAVEFGQRDERALDKATLAIRIVKRQADADEFRNEKGLPRRRNPDGADEEAAQDFNPQLAGREVLGVLPWLLGNRQQAANQPLILGVLALRAALGLPRLQRGGGR